VLYTRAHGHNANVPKVTWHLASDIDGKDVGATANEKVIAFWRQQTRLPWIHVGTLFHRTFNARTTADFTNVAFIPVLSTDVPLGLAVYCQEPLMEGRGQMSGRTYARWSVMQWTVVWVGRAHCKSKRLCFAIVSYAAKRGMTRTRVDMRIAHVCARMYLVSLERDVCAHKGNVLAVAILMPSRHRHAEQALPEH